jgi:hypothetical protein
MADTARRLIRTLQLSLPQVSRQPLSAASAASLGSALEYYNFALYNLHRR